uniref:Adenylate cyclase type 10 n=1 Tax=Pogona vitticeps TaxID=103695 RepID=A0ABM5GDD3_9SAUR
MSTEAVQNEKKKKSEFSTIGKIAAHIPDLIVYDGFSQEVPFIKDFDGVLLFIDISGFTALTEKFSMNTNLDCGADELTQTLNHYVGDIVEEVLAFGGDILKFAGDALLALWKVERREINHIITLAVICSFKIQEDYGVRDTEVGQELRVKIGVSAGHISKVVVGDHIHQHFLVIGRAVDEVRLAQNLAKASEIILSPNCWELCDRKLIVVEKIPGERAVKVRYIKNLPGFSTAELLVRCAEHLDQNLISGKSGIFRYASLLTPDEELENHLRKYVMKNILRKIDDNQPLEYLSELRPVTTVFVNLQFDASANTDHLCKTIQAANMEITRVIHSLSGKMNKVFMFDKGCTFLCVFGLPGDKQADESTNALDSAHEIHAFCSTSLMKVKIVSIGITSGSVFCGVVGHCERHEYTVIGQKVNLAARMMMCYPGLVTCDSVTYANSKLPHYFFEELPLIEMKGVLNPGAVYQYLGITEKTMIYKSYLTRERSEHYPLLGRKKETDVFENLLNDFKVSPKSHVMVYEGPMGYGKSQLMAEVAYLGQGAGQKVVAMELTKINVWQNFFAIRTLMAMVLEIDTCKTYYARQYILAGKLREIIKEEYLCLLNNLFHVKFNTSQVVSKMNNDVKNKKTEQIFVKVLENAAKKEILIFVIDEAQFIDSASWDFLDNIMKKIAIFVVMSLSPINHKERLPCATAVRILNSPDTTFIQLRELTPSVIIQKACQDLGVVSIARELEIFLIQRSHGNPFYCEELLCNLYLNNVLQFHILKEDEERDDEWDSLFTTAILKTKDSEILNNESESYICTIRQNVKLHNIMLPPTLKGIALAELDNMNPSEQMVVKCASIIGVTFTTEFLLHILPEWTKVKMNQTLAALVESHIFQCFRGKKKRIATQKWDVVSNELYVCSAVMKSMGEESDPALTVFKRLKQEELVMQSEVMGFCTPLLQEAAYELWLKSQKKALHLKCAHYLALRAHRCECCGEGDFISFHRYAVDSILENISSLEPKPEKAQERRLTEAAGEIVSETLKKLDSTAFEVHRAEVTELKFLKRMDEIILLIDTGKKSVKTTESSECQCEEILESVIVPLSQHCLALGNYTLAFYYLLECASGYVHLSNYYMAFMYLNTAESLLKSSEDKQNIISHFEESVFYSLKGEVSYNMGQITLGKKMIKKALTLLKKSFPSTIVGVFFMYMMETSKHLSRQKKKALRQKSRGREKKLAILYQQAQCLSVLWQLFSLDLARSSKKFSRLAALMKVNCAEESQDESQIISSYMEFSLCCQLMGYQQEWLKYGLMAIERSLHLQVDGERLLIIAKLAQSLAYTKLCLGNLPLAIQMGFRAHDLCEQLKKSKLDCIVLLDLFTALFLSARYQDAVLVLSWLEELSIQDDNVIAQAAFISSCLNLMLYAGFSFKPFQYCLDFLVSNQTNCILMSQNNIMIGLYSSLANWFARLQLWDSFAHPFEQARRLVRRTSASLYANHGFCKFLECQILLLRKYIEEKSDKAQEMHSRIAKNLEHIMTQCSTSPVFYPRVYHLKAYFQLMLRYDENSHHFLEKAFQNSDLYGNHLELSWLEISKECWFTGRCPMEDLWLKTAPDFPMWKVGMTSQEMGPFYKNKYLLKVPELDIDNPFPEDPVDL